MEARIAIQKNGKISVFIDEAATAEEARRLSNALLEKLGDFLDIDIFASQPEQHRHGPGYEHQHVGGMHAHTHTH